MIVGFSYSQHYHGTLSKEHISHSVHEDITFLEYLKQIPRISRIEVYCSDSSASDAGSRAAVLHQQVTLDSQ